MEENMNVMDNAMDMDVNADVDLAEAASGASGLVDAMSDHPFLTLLAGGLIGVGLTFGINKGVKHHKAKKAEKAAKKSEDTAAAEEAPVTDGDYREVKPEEEKKAEDKQPENVTAQAEEVKPEEEKKTA